MENPTPLRVGMTGALEGWRCRIAGRVVMGMEYEGARYYWQEFNLVDEAGGSATLVYEETDEGPEWKLFREFTPPKPLNAAEAGQKRVGDKVNLDGQARPVTLVDQSRVFQIEGEAPEGVEVGDIANYFNVDAGDQMWVVSWSGHDVEYYEGSDATEEWVLAAFQVTPTPASASAFRQAVPGSAERSARLKAMVVLIAAIVAALGIAFTCTRSPRRTSTRASVAAPARPQVTLNPGVRGTLNGAEFTIEELRPVRVGAQGRPYSLREYRLAAVDGTEAWLINSLNGGAWEWHLLRGATVPEGLSPYDAAALKTGATVRIGGKILRITRLVRLDRAASAAQPAEVSYGFLADAGGESWVARWTETSLQFFQGRSLPQAEVVAAFPPR